ncbi:MAG: gluconate 2-dehydrogenase subunit 3 family protein [Gemmatimonadales bacterium]
MNRRDLLRLLGSAAIPTLAGLAPEQLLALGRSLHVRTATRGPSALRVLDDHQNATVVALAELIIPETDTPGARTARVTEFIDLLLAEWYTEDERARFLAGLADVDTRSRVAFGAEFVAAAPGQQAAIVSGLDAEVAALRDANADPARLFFHRMKYLTIYGYYTSEVGVTQELRYQVVPGRYDPCVATGIPSPGGE